MTRHSSILDFLEESNAIERVYGATALKDALAAWKLIENERVITPNDILRVHHRLMRNQPLEKIYKGAWREQQVWVGTMEGKSWPLIPSLIDQWVDTVTRFASGARREAGIEEELIREHHVQFENIHPFIDGNGRVGRILYNWERIRVGLPIHIIHHGNEQFEYYKWFS